MNKQNEFYLLDSRAACLAMENNNKLETEDNGKYILVVGTLKECCKDANSGDYGDGNVVSDSNYNILWEIINDHGHFVAKNYKPNGETI